MGKLKYTTVIHGFTALHVIATYFSFTSSILDSRLVTPLTLLMTIFLCIAGNVNFRMSSALLIFSNIIGYMTGMKLMRDIAHLMNATELVNQMIASGLTTELVGWCTVLFIRATGEHFKRDRSETTSGRYLTSMLIVMAGIYVFRFLISLLTTNEILGKYTIYGYTTRYFNNSILIVTILIINVALVRMLHSRTIAKTWLRTLACIAAAIVIALAAALVCQYSYAADHNLAFPNSIEYIRYFIVGLLLETGLIFIIILITTTFESKYNARQAEYHYINLRNQLSPHFLINSLNVLNGLVQSDRKNDAEEYIHKLTDIYQYCLMIEDTGLISLGKEMENLDNYIDLLNVRFNGSLMVDNRIMQSDLSKEVVPCAIQLLVENAVKHNSLREDKPLTVEIFSDGSTITVRNNIRPRYSKTRSNGIGLHYIKEQYRSHCGKDILISHTAGHFTVSLPLI
ncbi:MAG: histidine kinase [Bacteroidales bacterium]|nr:histidine kinase [Bacteroidales bacterium]MDE6147328.1 histidine kinase [Bacteroidales bacterium]